MDPQNIPKRPLFWFNRRSATNGYPVILFDRINLIYIGVFVLLSFVIFWPIIAKITFEEVFFTPLVPFLISVLSIFGFNADSSLRFLFIGSLMISTVGIYLFVYDLTKRRVTAILTSVLYLIPPMPIFILSLFFSGRYQSQLISAKSFFTIIYGDGAHFLALALIAFAALFFLRYIKSDKTSDLVITVLACAFILLASRSQALSLFLVLTVVALTDLFLGNARIKFKRFLLVLLISLGLVSFWYTPSFWQETLIGFFNQLKVNLKFLFPLPVTIGFLTLFASFVFFGKREDRQPIFFSFLLFIIFLILVGEWLWYQRSLLPHPQRLVPNLNMFAAIVSALTLTAIIDRLRLVKTLAVETWSAAGKALGALIFGVVSFLLLAIVAFALFPWVTLLISGPNGLWTKIKMGVLADRQETLAFAGKNFGLVRQHTDGWQLWLGVALSLFFMAILIYMILKNEGEE